jgi:hypothetical protein
MNSSFSRMVENEVMCQIPMISKSQMQVRDEVVKG